MTNDFLEASVTSLYIYCFIGPAVQNRKLVGLQWRLDKEKLNCNQKGQDMEGK